MGSSLFATQQYGVEGVWDGQCSSTGWRESGMGSSLFAMQQYGVEGVWDGQFPADGVKGVWLPGIPLKTTSRISFPSSVHNVFTFVIRKPLY